MRNLGAYTILAVFTLVSPVAAQIGGMNNNAGGADPSNIPGSMGSGTTENSPTEKPGETQHNRSASAMSTPTPDGASIPAKDGDAHVTGK
jgi:hypothetical protein